MANPKDFSARQIRASQLIASGGIGGTKAGLIIYSASIASNLIGGFAKDAGLLADVGDDVYVFVSGSKDSKVARGDAGNGLQGVTLFGGDVVFSGTMYAEKMVVEVDLATTGSLLVSGSLFVSRSATINQGLTVNAEYGSLFPQDIFTVFATEGGEKKAAFTVFTSPADVDLSDPAVYVNPDNKNIDFAVKTGPSGKNSIYVDAEREYVAIMSGGTDSGVTDPGPRAMTDTNFYVSGNIGSAGTSIRGTSVFGGDVVISGSLSSGAGVFSLTSSMIDIGWDPNTPTTSIGPILRLTNHDSTVNKNTTIGALEFYARDLHTKALGAQIKAVPAGIWDGGSSEDAPTDLQFLTNDDTANPPETRLFVSSSGKVGINTKVPVGILDVLGNGTSDKVFFLSGSGGKTSYDESLYKDTAFFVSGSIGKRGTTTRGVAVFGGDLHVSGNITSEGASGEWFDEGDILRPRDGVGESVGVGGTTNAQMEYDIYLGNLGAAYFNQKELGTPGDSFRVSTKNRKGGIEAVYATDTVFILSGGGGTSPNPNDFIDTAFFVSGSIGSVQNGFGAGQLSNGDKGATVFGGDVVISGTLFTPASTIYIGGAKIGATPTGELLLLSGGGGTSLDPSVFSDTNFFVSGSKFSHGTTTRGTSVFGGDLVVSGNFLVGQVIGVESNPNATNINLQSTQMSFNVGSNSFLDFFEGFVDQATVNPGHSNINFVAETGTLNKHGLFVSSLDDRVLILSGGNSGRTPNESMYPDLSFFVSGAIGSKGTGVRGTSVFGGDVVISGSLFGGSPLSVLGGAVFNEIGLGGADFRVESNNRQGALLVDSANDQVAILNDGTSLPPGSDLSLFVSGAINSRGTTVKGTSVFGGDVVISGSLSGGSPLVIRGGAIFNNLLLGGADFRVASTGESQALYVDSSTNELWINKGESAFTTIIGSEHDEAIRVDIDGVTVNRDSQANNDFIVKTAAKSRALLVDAGKDQVLILSGGGGSSFNEANAADVNFYVSGSTGNRGTSTRGTSVFGGDLFVSGTIFSGEALGGAISGSLTRTAIGKSYLVAGTNVTIASSSNGQVTINSTAGGTVDGSGAATRLAYWSDADTLTSNLNLTTDGDTLSVNGLIVNDSGLPDAAADFRVESDQIQGMIISDASTNQLILHSSGTDSTTVGSKAGSDVAIYLSGTVGSAGVSNSKGTSVFTGDMVASGTVAAKLGLSGSLTRLTSGLSYLSAGTNITIASSSNGQVTISSTGGGSVDGAGAAKRLAYWADSDTLMSNSGLHFNEFTLGLTGSASGVTSALDIHRIYSNTAGNSGITSHAGASGILIDYDVTSAVAGGQFQKHAPLWIKYDQSSPSHAGTVQGTGIKVEMTGSISGVQTIDGISVIVNNPGSLASDASRGITINAPAGWVDGTSNGSHLRCLSQADTGDYFDISVGESGLTQLTTIDSDAAAAHLNLKPDGMVTILSGGGAGSSNESTYSDTNFFVSGTLGSRGTAVAGTSVFGGDVFVSGALGINTITMTTDGKIGIGVDSPSYKLSVGGNMEVGEYIYHRGDDNTFIRFQADSIKVNAGNVDMVSITEGAQNKIVFNEGGADVDFRVESTGRDHALFVDGDNDQILILSGGGATSFNEAAGSDISFYVSGSKTVGFTNPTNGVSVFGGDLVTSGNLRVSEFISRDGDADTQIRFSDDRIRFNLGGTGFIDLREDSSQDYIWLNYARGDVDFYASTNNKDYGLFVNAANDQVLVLSGGNSGLTPNEAAYTDLGFFVSGSILSKGTGVRGTSIFGGDAVVSGAFYLEELSSTPGSVADGTVALYGKDDGGVTKLYFKNESGETEVGAGGGASEWTEVTAAPSSLVSPTFLRPSDHSGVQDIGLGHDVTNPNQYDVYIGADGSAFFNMQNGSSPGTRFEVRTGNRPGALLVDYATDIVHILSGGGATSPNPNNFFDTCFSVSGSIGSLGTGVKGAAVFGGDTVVSGALVVNDSQSAMLPFIASSANKKGAIVIDQFDQVGILSDDGSIPVATDMSLHVSGAKGLSKVSMSKGTAVFGGDVVISGSLHTEYGVVGAYESLNSNFVIGSHHHIVGIDTTSAVVTASLPGAAGAPAGRMLIFKDTGGNAATKNIVIDPDGTEKIDGVLQAKITSNSGSMSIFSDGLGWHIYGVS
jgi:hypothetical protein